MSFVLGSSSGEHVVDIDGVLLPDAGDVRFAAPMKSRAKLVDGENIDGLVRTRVTYKP
jgi:hypothetical protein